MTVKFLKQKIDYIHQNPVKREIVAYAEDYLYSSAVNYAGKKRTNRCLYCGNDRIVIVRCGL